MIPTQCTLWKKEKLTLSDLAPDNFEFVERLPDISNVSEQVKRCKECGQLYLFEYNDFFASPWSDDLPIYMTYVPISEDELKEHYKVAKTLTSILETGNPSILHNIKQGEEEVRWNR
jgi:hypothetical protein